MTTSCDSPEPGQRALTPDVRLYRSAGVRALDAQAIEAHGIPGLTLMTRAGQSAFSLLRRRWPAARRIAVLCGTGNNGGDGFVVARLARESGLSVRVFLLGERDSIAGHSKLACSQMEYRGVSLEDSSHFRAHEFEVVVDGLFGTGLSRPLAGDAAALVDDVNAASAGRLALDVPSGLSGDSGTVMGTAVRADATVTFIGLKQGLFTGDGPDFCGDVVVDTLDVPEAVYKAVNATAFRVNGDNLGQPLGPRPRKSHKGRFGHVLVVGGDFGYAGAVRLCAEACARTGAGLTSVATRPEHVAVTLASRPELMVRGVNEPAELRSLLAAASVVAVGPGLGRGPWATKVLGAVLDHSCPRVLDADALNLMASGFSDWSVVKAPGCVITPHPGEAARVLGTTVASLEADRFAAAQALVELTGCVVVLKGAGSLVQAPGRRPRVVDAGNPGMASGGMGDLLTGIIAALMAQGLCPMDAAVTGAVLHAEAGDAAARRQGERGLLASDLLPDLRVLVQSL